jgi:hypothetical protein
MDTNNQPDDQFLKNMQLHKMAFCGFNQMHPMNIIKYGYNLFLSIRKNWSQLYCLIHSQYKPVPMKHCHCNYKIIIIYIFSTLIIIGAHFIIQLNY